MRKSYLIALKSCSHNFYANVGELIININTHTLCISYSTYATLFVLFQLSSNFVCSCSAAALDVVEFISIKVSVTR